MRSALVALVVVLTVLAAGCGSGTVSTTEPTVPASVIADSTTPTVTTPTVTTPTATTPPATTVLPTTVPPTTVLPTTVPPTTVLPTTVPPTTVPPTTVPPTTVPPETRATRVLQERLSSLGYWLGAVDGQFGPSTAHAVIAFQKVQGLATTGVGDAATLAALDTAVRPVARYPNRNGFEVDVGRQVGLVVRNGAVAWVVDISSGKAATPTVLGDYSVYREVDGNRYAPLGVLYRPKYFTGGYAIHGYPSVPSYPASHGCVRVTFAAMDMLWANNYLPMGSPVTTYR